MHAIRLIYDLNAFALLGTAEEIDIFVGQMYLKSIFLCRFHLMNGEISEKRHLLRSSNFIKNLFFHFASLTVSLET